MSFWSLVVPAFFSLSALVAPTPEPQDTPAPQDETRTLDEIIAKGYQPPEFAPTTGKFLFRPVVYLGVGNNGSSIRQIDFFFSPIVETIDSTAKLYKEQDRQRFRVSVTVPVVNPTGTRFRFRGKKIGLPTQSIDLPGGAYVLSEIRYSFSSPTGAGLRLAVTEQTFARSFCLGKETYAFDIENGKKQFLGGMAITPFPSNIARLRDYHPIIGVDSRLDLLSGSAAKDVENIEPMEFDLLAFEPEPGLCASGGRKLTAALAN